MATNDHLSPGARASGSYVWANLGTQGARVALTGLITVFHLILLSPENLGKTYLSQSGAFIMARAIVFGLNRAGALLSAEQGPEIGVLVTTRACLRNALIVAPIGTSALVAVQTSSGVALTEAIALGSLSALWALFAALSVVFAEVFRFSDRQIWALSLQGALGGLAAGVVAAAALLLVGVLAESLDATKTVLIMTSSSALPVILAISRFLPRRTRLELRGVQHETRSASLSPGAAQTAQLVITELPLWICSSVLGPAQAAAYGLASRIAAQSGTIPHVVATATSPAALSALQHDELRPALQRRLARIYTPVALLGMGGLTLLYVVSRIFEARLPYTAVKAAELLPIVGLPYVAMALAGCPGYVLQLSRHARLSVHAQLTGLGVLGTGLASSVHFQLGLTGFAAAAASAGVSSFALEWFFARRHLAFDASLANLDLCRRRSKVARNDASTALPVSRAIRPIVSTAVSTVHASQERSQSIRRPNRNRLPMRFNPEYSLAIREMRISPGAVVLCLYGLLVPSLVIRGSTGATDLLALSAIIILARRPDVVSVPFIASYFGFVLLLTAASSAQMDLASAARAARVGIHALPLLLCIAVARPKLHVVSRCAWLGGLAALSFAIVAYLLGWGDSQQELFVGEGIGNIPRAAGLVGNTAPFAHLAATWMMFGALIAPRYFRRHGVVQILSVVVGLTAILLSSSRGGLVNVLVASSLFVGASLAGGRGRSRSAAALATGLCISLVGALQIGPRIWTNPTLQATSERLNPFATASDGRVSTFFSSSGRTSTWPEAISYIAAHPLGGGVKAFEDSTGLVIDNSFLAAFAWSGIIGGSLFVLFWVLVSKWAWSCRRLGPGLALFSIAGGQVAQFMVGEFFTQWYSMPFAFLVIGIAMRETIDLRSAPAIATQTKRAHASALDRTAAGLRLREAVR